MRKLFPGYYRPTEDEFNALWRDCIFSFDANILLNVYRYTPKTRKRFFEILEALSGRIWITHQAAQEYQKNRLTVISQQLNPYKELQKLLDEHLEKLKKTLGQYNKRHSFNAYFETKQIMEPIQSVYERTKEILAEASAQYPDLVDRDIFREKLTDLVSGSVGKPYSEEDLEKIYKQAESRFKKNLPPGYLDIRGDKKKEPPDCYGDVIVWFQLVEYAKSKKQPIIFVTDEDGEDWWLEHQGKTYSPRPELAQEMLSKANVAFYLYTGDRFLEYAENFLLLSSEPEVIEEAREIRLEAELTKPLKARLVALLSVATAVSGSLPGTNEFNEQVLELSEKLGIHLPIELSEKLGVPIEQVQPQSQQPDVNKTINVNAIEPDQP